MMERKKSIYDEVKLSSAGRDIAVIVLSFLLLICFIAAFIMGA